MKSRPLPGPQGLYTVSAMPRFLADSSAVGWAGAFFTAVQAVPEGRVDHGHARLCVRRTLQPEWRRSFGRAGWERIGPTVQVLQAGDDERFDWRDGCRSQFLFVSGEQVTQVLDRAPRSLPTHGMLGEGGARLFGLLLDALEADLADGSPAGPSVGDSVIAALIGHLAAAPAPAPAARSLGAPGRRRALDLIEARFAQPLSLDELSRAAGLSVRQFTRAFREAMGCSPHQYILRRRVDHAKRLIAEGRGLAEVAQHCGFADQSQLTRTFVRCTGLTPGRFRAQQRR